MAVNQPVALHLTYEEHMFFSGKRSGSYSNIKVGCDENGKLTGVVSDIAVDHGAYRESEYLIERTARFTLYPYFVPNAAVLARIYNTNNVFGTAYRGFGSPQIYTAGESIMDILAEKAGIDPFEFRWRNIARPGETSISSLPYRNYPMEEIMTKMRPFYEKAVEEAKAADTPKVRRGVGVCWGGYAAGINQFDTAEVALELGPDGTVTKYDTWQDVGQGGDIGSLMMVLATLEPLGLTPDKVHLVQSDSKYCPNSGPSGSSRSTFINSNATKMAAERLLDAMRKPDGGWRTYDEMVAEGIPTKYQVQYSNTVLPNIVPTNFNTGVGDHIPIYNYMFFLAEVAVDTETGKTSVLRFTCIDDVGKVTNIDSLNGQAYSGIAHGIGFALSEDYHDTMKHPNLVTCGFPYIKDIPDDITVIHCENFRAENALGSSGAAEGFQSSSHVAVLNAIANACGVRIYELPAKPEKVKAGLEKLEHGEKVEPPAKFFLGSDVFEELDYILANPV
jgi:aldehyde oxidoreductase